MARGPRGDAPNVPIDVRPALELSVATAHALLARTAGERPHHPVVVFGDRVMSARELLERAEAIAGFLQRHAGVARGDRVLLYAQNSPEFIAAYHAIHRADAVAVLASPLHLRDEVAHCVLDSGARVAIAGPELLDRLEPLLGTPLRHVLSLGGGAGERVTAWDDALARALAPAPHAAQADDACLIAYTSGTTGKPKGCVHTHASLLAAAMTMAHWRGNTRDSVILGTAPMFHLMGLQGSITARAYIGCTLVLMARWDVAAAAEAIARHRVTHWGVMPTIVVDLMAHAEHHGLELRSLALLSGGGGRMPPAALDRLRSEHGVEFMECYGMTETAGVALANPRDELRRACLGVPTYGVDARVIDPVSLCEVAEGETGEIVIRGGQVMREYWNNAEASAAAFVPIDGHAFLRTGDLGRRDADGFFYMVDRLKRMVSVSGYKVWPAEVEDVLQSHPAVAQACVIGVPDARRGEAVKAFVVAREPIDSQTLIDWLRARMASYKCPRAIEFVAKLPVAATGKVDWRSLQEAARAEPVTRRA